MRTHIYESRIYSTGITGMFVILYRYHRYVPHTLPEDIHEDGSGSAKKKKKKRCCSRMQWCKHCCSHTAIYVSTYCFIYVSSYYRKTYTRSGIDNLT